MLRVGTFNIENLFDRPAIINMEDSKKSSQLLKLADRLQVELNRKTYDKVKIRELLDELKGYVTIRVDTGRFFKTKTGGAVAAEGPQDWAGAMEFTREKFDSRQRKSTADAIKALKADILCLVEVKGRQALSDFNREFFSGQSRYPFNMLIDSSNDPRGIDIALQWKDGNPGVLRSNAYDQAMIQKN
ncbi:MAG: hypothetical protein FJX29_08995 [Alphaproteobacteria bacterium]|nr:hypothetical protein [Alphaproteobacteria bacterium]